MQAHRQPGREAIQHLPTVLRPGSEPLRQLAYGYGLRLVILFGSRARGEAGVTSDFDLAVSMTDPYRRAYGELTEGEAHTFQRLHSELQRMLATSRVDLVLLERAAPLVVHRVVRDGIPLFEATPGAFVRLCVRAVQMIEDARPMLQAQRRYLARVFGPGEPW
ncbi:type VII toxin-antitoxin system MntA family adenylyltransferase antitoxin [Geochorda subterranea]|uniref:Nucleotidyltransferase domain-containing protein n=1 Tax=Geochorda subterranea TaxID=3109564 RepID=A0ABZ1BT48_9FIRM|nr:nucleotidyltransferase domain-containing protein [Limnochorda sp. LNt]WRP15635.1 nucleotidyltransferase domain-containing protein [Limnochorda sp. LNt]